MPVITKLKTDVEYQINDERVDDLITNVDNLSNEIQNIPQKQRIITIGDSYGFGYSVGVLTSQKGWQYWAKNDLENENIEIYNIFAQSEGVSGFASSLPFLKMLKEGESVIPNHNTITKIVVLGGTNDIGISSTLITDAIQTFMNYVKTEYPNAKVNIGVLGTHINDLYEKIYNVYYTCQKFGANFIKDTLFLYCNREYIDSDNLHLKQSGYEYYSQWTNNIVLNDNCSYNFNFDMPVEKSSEMKNYFNKLHIICEVTEKNFKIFINGNQRNYAGVATIELTNKGFNTDGMYEFGQYTPIVNLPLYYTQMYAGNIFGVSNISGNQVCMGIYTIYVQDDNKLGAYIYSGTKDLTFNLRLIKSSELNIQL